MICNFYDGNCLQRSFEWQGIEELPFEIHFDGKDIYTFEFVEVSTDWRFSIHKRVKYVKLCETSNEFNLFIARIANLVKLPNSRVKET